MICTMLDCRKSLNQLVLNGASLINEEEKEKPLSDSENEEDSLLKSAFDSKNHDIMESILRDVTLKKAVSEGEQNEVVKEYLK